MSRRSFRDSNGCAPLCEHERDHHAGQNDDHCFDEHHHLRPLLSDSARAAGTRRIDAANSLDRVNLVGDPDNGFAAHVPVLDVAEGGAGLGEGIDPVDDDAQLSRLDHPRQLEQVGGRRLGEERQ